jgi:hypothetical protein
MLKKIDDAISKLYLFVRVTEQDECKTFITPILIYLVLHFENFSSLPERCLHISNLTDFERHNSYMCW